MAGIDRSTQRVIAVIALMIVAALALRGYIPGGEPITERERPPSNPAALIVVVAMVCVAVAIIGFAIIARLRDRTPTPASAGPLPRGSGATARPSWRVALVALALLIGWLVLVLVLMRLGGQSDQTPAGTPADQETVNPAPDTAPQPAPADPEPETDSNVVGYLIPPMLTLMVVVIVGTAIASRRQRAAAVQYPADDDGTTAVAPTAGDSLVRAAEVGLAEIGDRTREPREAIIACYAAMEGELTRVPGAVPQDCDTPSEVLARAVDNRGTAGRQCDRTGRPVRGGEVLPPRDDRSAS